MTRSRWLLAASFVTLLVAALWSRTETPRAPVAPALAGTKAEPDNIVAQRFPRTPDLVAIRANFDGTLAPEIKLSTPDPKSRWRNPAKPVETTFPEKFTDPVRVRCGIADVLARPLNGNAESRAKTLPDGSLVYEDAFEGADVHYRCSAFKTEEFIVVHEVVSPPLEGGGRGRGEPRTFKWRLDLNAGEKPLKARLTPAHTIELCDEQGVPRLRINAPVAKDASGRVLREGKELCYAINGDELCLSADLRGCKFPVVIDPTWSSTGTMAVEHISHTATLLNNGRVLIAGGTPSAPTVVCELYDPSSGTFSTTGNLNTGRTYQTATRLADGRVLITGGAQGSTVLGSCEIYDPGTGAWIPVMSMSSPRIHHTAALLPNGRVLVAGGNISTSSPAADAACEIYDAGSNTWASTDSLNPARTNHASTVLPDGRVLVAGGSTNSSVGTEIQTCQVFNPTLGANGMWVSAGSLPASDATGAMALLSNGDAVFVGSNTSQVSRYSIGQGTWASLPPQTAPHTYPVAVAVANDDVLVSGTIGPVESGAELLMQTGQRRLVRTVFTNRQYQTLTVLLDGRALMAGGGGFAIASQSAEVFSLNDPPSVNAIVSPGALVPGQSALFTANAADPNDDPLTFLWEFGDGTSATAQNPIHSYASTGVYTATVTANDSQGFGSTSSVTILVLPSARAPTARFTTSDVVGFVGAPLTFDASLSTDPENNITGYAWNFGDGSPAGSKQILSKIYDAVGTYSVTLTVTDGEGLTATSTRSVVILPADQQGLFNSVVTYKVRWDRNKENADTFSLDATVNVGDAAVTAGTNVAVEIAGKRFEATLDAKLKAKTLTQSFTVTSGTRKQAAGEARIRLTAKKASLGAGFNSSGIVAGADPSEFVEASVPIKLEIAGRVFEVLLDSEFKFSKDGRKASGSGDGP